MTPLPPPVIIAVDDEADDLFFLRRIIEKAEIEHRFQPFSNGEAAIVALSSLLEPNHAGGLPLACFLDIKLVGMTGFELLTWIRSQRGLDALPVIMFSSSDHPADVDKARELGAQGYLKKYPSVAAMRTVLEEAREFAASDASRKTFLRWSYRFIESGEKVTVE